MEVDEKNNVLIVDDDPELLDAAKSMLSDDYCCMHAESVEKAVEIVENQNIHVILTDLRMPKQDGVDLLKYVKNGHQDIPVIVMTGFASKESAMEVANLGAHEIIEKPLNETALNMSIKRALLVRKTIEERYNLMVAKFCHEISTPITGILMLAQLLSRELTKFHAEEKVEEKQVHQVSRIIVLGQRVRDMIKLSKEALLNQESKSDHNNLYDVISESVKICDYAGLLENAEIFHDGVDRNLYVNGSAIKLSQIFINLFKNAIQANHNNKENWVKVSTEVEGPYIKISVVDCGHGVPEEIAAKIFTETFTTKSFDKGTGLGLNICRSIAESHGGSLSLDMDASNTTFVVKLPRS